jgi:predicted ATPase/class 3 adenylate cyclase
MTGFVTGPLPTGTVTFLFTDIEGSTPHWESQPALMEVALKVHNDILFTTIKANGGKVFKIVGDEFQAAFPTALQALQAAIDAQVGLQNASWNELGPLRVRMGLHTGEAHPDDIGDEYAVSHTKNRVGRIRSAAHGGQIVLSQESADLCASVLPKGVILTYLGEFRMKGLARREPVYQVIAPGLPERFPPLVTLAEPRHNLPRQLTPFIGRGKEREQVKDILANNSMVTLTGSGGVGKTRLSIQVAEDLVEAFADGIWYVELSSLTDPSLVVQAVALTLGLRQQTSRPLQEMLNYFLKTRQILLVLDNCEHLIDACARLVDNLLRGCPQVKILASSREALGVVGEMVYHVPSLSLPDLDMDTDLVRVSDYDAVRLFMARGKAVLPSFHVTPENATHILSICQRLDGIPLALELAAARLNVLSTEQLAARLDNTFRLLVGGARTAVPRQQTLRATIDWSFQLINEKERQLLRRLAVFVGGFSLNGAEAVCAGDGLEEVEILDLLTSLVNKSMVITDRVQGTKTRYHLLETVRQYAREKLFDAGESEALRNRHLDYYVSFVDQAVPQIHGVGRLMWTAYLKAEHANIREALEWAFKDSELPLKGLRIATAITDRFWFTQNFREGERWLKRGLQIAGKNIPIHLQARVYYCLGRIMALNEKQQCQQYLNQCIALCREIAPLANRELALALSLSASGLDSETALARTEEGVQVALTIASTDVWPLAEALYFRSNVLLLVGSIDQALATAQECVRVSEMGDRWMAGGYWLSGVIQTLMDQPGQALINLEKGLDLCLAVDDRFGVWYSLIYLTWHYLYVGDLHQAYVYCQDLLKLNDRFKTQFHFYDLGFMGILLASYQIDTNSTLIPSMWLDAVRLLAAFEKWGESLFTLDYEFIRKIHQSALSFLRQKINQTDFEAAWQEGNNLWNSLDDAVTYAQSLGEKYNFLYRTV